MTLAFVLTLNCVHDSVIFWLGSTGEEVSLGEDNKFLSGHAEFEVVWDIQEGIRQLDGSGDE
jgi:hypothetical protein